MEAIRRKRRRDNRGHYEEEKGQRRPQGEGGAAMWRKRMRDTSSETQRDEDAEQMSRMVQVQ